MNAESGNIHQVMGIGCNLIIDDLLELVEVKILTRQVKSLLSLAIR